MSFNFAWLQAKGASLQDLAYDDDESDDSEESSQSGAPSSPAPSENPFPSSSTPTLHVEESREESSPPMAEAPPMESEQPEAAKVPDIVDPSESGSPTPSDFVPDAESLTMLRLSSIPSPVLEDSLLVPILSDFGFRPISRISDAPGTMDSLPCPSEFEFRPSCVDSTLSHFVKCLADLRTREGQLLEKTQLLVDAHGELESLRQQNRKLQVQLQTTAAANGSRGSSRWRDLARKRKEEYDELLEEGKEMAAEIGGLKEKLVSLATCVRERDGTIAELRESVTDMEKKLETASRDAVHVSRMRSVASESVIEKKQLVADLASERERVQELVEEKESLERQLRSGVETAADERQAMKEHLMETITTLQITLRTRTEESLRKIGALSRQIERLQSDRQTLDDSNLRSNPSSSDVSGPFLAQIADLEAKAHEKESEWIRMKKSMEEETVTLRETVRLSTERIAQLERRQASVDAEKEQLRAAAESRRIRIERSLAEATQRLATETDRCAQLQHTLQEEIEKRQTLDRTVRDLQREALRESSSTVSDPEFDNLQDSPPSTEQALPSSSSSPLDSEVRIEQLRLARDQMNSQLQRCQRDNSRLRRSLAVSEGVSRELDEVKLRYVAAREIIAEKNSMIREIQDDFEHAKSMFRKQLVQLLSQVEKQEASSEG